MVLAISVEETARFATRTAAILAICVLTLAGSNVEGNDLPHRDILYGLCANLLGYVSHAH